MANWILLSLAMYVFSVAYYLVTRSSLLRGVPTTVINLTNNASVSVIALFVGSMLGRQFALPPLLLAITFIAGAIFSYWGNKFSLKSIAVAPNPGYSLIVSKSYVVLTTLVAVLFLNAPLSLKNGLAIAAIVLFQLFILIDKPGDRQKNNGLGWLFLAFVSFFCYGFLTLTSKYLFLKGVDPLVFLAYVAAINSFFFSFDAAKSWKAAGGVILANRKNLFILCLLYSSFNFALFEAIQAAPNVGYVNAINVASISAVTVGAALLLKDHLSAMKLVGIAGVTLGLVVLVI